MCGIIGQYCFKGTPDRELIDNMSKILEHRGPDAKGTYFSGNVGLAHRRLSIIDLSRTANQPMFNEDRSIVIIYNGELYNYMELKSLLVQNGHEFHTISDTEVIIHAYEEWGMNCLTQFNGMWAFAIWDEKKKSLFCARDRFGIKPFYYTLIDNSLLFASEIKALLAHPGVGTSPNEFKVNEFLLNGISDNTNNTMFSGVYQLPPSEGIIITNNIVRRFKYCDLEISSNINSIVTKENVASNILYLLKKSVKKHLMSDVPVGTCLSGGIDSSAIVKLVNEKHQMQNTFSACFSDEKFDESKYIKLVVKDTLISPFYIEPTPQNFLKDIDHLIYIQDEPFGSLSIYAQYCVMQLAQGKVKVLLDGQGADELFAGYLAYQKNYISDLINKKEFFLAFGEIIGTLHNHKNFYYYAARQTLERKNRRELFTSHDMRSIRYKGKFSTMLHNELFMTNLPSLLHFEDRNSMAFSIEARVPYLDLEFSNYIASLPYDQKIRNGVTKHSLRNALKDVIPEEIRMRMDKMGFVTPEETWMKYELKDYIMDILFSTSFKNREFWNSDRVIESYQKFLDGKSIYTPEIWRIVCTELWLRKFFDNRSTLFSCIL